MFTILLFYKFIHIQDTETLQKVQKSWCKELDITGRIIVAQEGINATLEGKASNIEEYKIRMLNDPRFSDIHWKESAGTGFAFPRLSVKIRDEIVATRWGKDLGPHKNKTGKYVDVDTLHSWIENKEDMVLIDMRNIYEYELGRFKGAIFPTGMVHFRDLSHVIKNLDDLKKKKIITYCTGGIRCEKASGYLQEQGFIDVYQLRNGIHAYLEKYRGKHWEGKLYVFDGREAWLPEGVTTENVGKCRVCQKRSENLANWYERGVRLHGIVCEECLVTNKVSVSK